MKHGLKSSKVHWSIDQVITSGSHTTWSRCSMHGKFLDKANLSKRALYDVQMMALYGECLISIRMSESGLIQVNQWVQVKKEKGVVLVPPVEY